MDRIHAQHDVQSPSHSRAFTSQFVLWVITVLLMALAMKGENQRLITTVNKTVRNNIIFAKRMILRSGEPALSEVEGDLEFCWYRRIAS